MSRARDFADLAGSADAGGLTGRNVLINGNYDIWQRGTSFTDVAGIWHYGFADRWNGHNDGADAGTFSQSTTVPNSGSKYSLLMTGASSVTNTNVSQRVESVNMQGIRAANSMTLSGYVRSATAGKTIQFYGLAPTATDNFSSYTFLGSVFSKTTMSGNGTGGTIAIGLTDADTWYYFTATATNVNSQTNFDKGFALYASILSQTSSSHQVYFSQLQLEAGETATPFEHRSYDDELYRCQRYFIKAENIANSDYLLTLQAYATTGIYGTIAQFPRPMRTTPSVGQGGTFGAYTGTSANANMPTTIGSFQSSDIGWKTGGWAGGSGFTAGDASVIYWNNGAYMTADAEL